MNADDIKARRLALGWSIVKLAEASGVTYSTIADYEAQRRKTQVGKLHKIKKALDEGEKVLDKAQ